MGRPRPTRPRRTHDPGTGTSLDALAGHLTDRVCLDTDLFQRRLLAALGVIIDPGALLWTTAHGDLHWAKPPQPRLLAARLGILGQRTGWLRRRPATRVSLVQLDIAERVYTTFADILTGHDGTWRRASRPGRPGGGGKSTQPCTNSASSTATKSTRSW